MSLETDYLDENSILNQMTKYDNLVQKYFNILHKYQSAANEIQAYMENVDETIKKEFEKIEEEMTNRLRTISANLFNSNDQMLVDNLKYKNEVLVLTQDNNSLLDEIVELKEKIKNMQKRIGENKKIDKMNFTK